jgi:hypothetical protein
VVLNSKVFFDILDPLIVGPYLTISFDTQVFFGIIARLDYFDFTIFLHDFIHLRLGLARQQQMALLKPLISITSTDLSYLAWKLIATVAIDRISRSSSQAISLVRQITIKS